MHGTFDMNLIKIYVAKTHNTHRPSGDLARDLAKCPGDLAKCPGDLFTLLYNNLYHFKYEEELLQYCSLAAHCRSATPIQMCSLDRSIAR